MTAVIISGFPGIGKSSLSERTLDQFKILKKCGSSFVWDRSSSCLSEVGLDPDFSKIYVARLHHEREDFDAIVTSTHQNVVDALVASKLPFVLVYPECHLKAEYMDRYIDRGSPDSFIRHINDQWDDLITKLEAVSGCKHVRLKAGQYLSDILSDMIADSRVEDVLKFL